MEADFLLNQAADVVDEAEKEDVLGKIRDLLDAHPGAPCVFMLIDAEPPETTSLETVVNCDIPLALWIASAFKQIEMQATFMRYEPEEDPEEGVD